MGVNRRGLTWWLVGGLAAVFIGERAFGGVGALRWALLLSGAVVVIGVTVLRLRSWTSAEGDERRIERAFALAYLGCLVAMIGLLVGTEDGVGWLGLDFEEIREELRFRRGFLMGSSILMVASLLPALAAQWGVRFGGADRATSLPIESLRVTQTAAASLSVALAGAFVVLTGYVAAANDWTFDASYFKTSSPGTSTQEIVGGMAEPLRVLLFFPEVDPVKDEVRRYFREMEGLTGNVSIEEYDRLAQPRAAEEYDVEVDGTIVLMRGGRAEHLLVPTQLSAARSHLRVFDSHVQRALLKLARNQLVAYITVGHGELNDPFESDAARPLPAGGEPPLGALRRLLELLSYEVRNLGLQTGLGERVPDDAASLLIIGPQRPFLDEEMRVVQEYLDRGGSLLLALEPGSDFSLEPLRDRLGVEFRSVTLADDQQHMRQRGGLADRRLIITNRITGHAAVTTASRRGIGSGILLAGAGHLVPAEDVDGPRTSFIIQSMSSTFADLNDDLQFDEDTESRGGFELAAAVEGPAGPDNRGLRSLVYADAEMFSDPVLVSLEVNAALAADGIRWLAREEDFAGETLSEADVPIVHTRAEDVAWFYAIIFGAPVMVLGIGLVFLFSPRWGKKETVA